MLCEVLLLVCRSKLPYCGGATWLRPEGSLQVSKKMGLSPATAGNYILLTT